MQKWVWGVGSFVILGVIFCGVYALGPTGLGFGGSRGPSIQFESQVRDLGRVAQWQPQAVEFSFRNEGTADLQVNPDIFSSSEKARAEVSPSTLPPGAEGKVTVQFQPGDLEGKQNMFFVLRTNDEERSTVTLNLNAELESKFWVDPPSIALGALTSGQEIEDRVVKLRWQKGRNIGIKKIISDHDDITVTSTEVEESDGRGIDLNISVKPQIAKTVGDFTRTFRAKIQVHTTFDARRIVMIPITGNLTRSVSIAPRVLKLGAVAKGDRLQDVIEIRSNTGEPFEVLEVENQCSFVQTRLETVEENLHYRLHLTIQPMEVLGEVDESIVIRTNVPFSEEMACRVVGVINP